MKLFKQPPQDFAIMICNMIGLDPDTVIRLRIDADAGELPIVTVEIIPELDEIIHGEFVIGTQRYRLEPLDD